MIYLDSCAIVKLLVPERETPAFLAWLNQRSGESWVTSALSEVEVPRAVRRADSRALARVRDVLSRLDRFEVDAPVRATAGAYRQPILRSLDAIHLATADNLIASGKHVTVFVTYDKRLAAAAVEEGFTVAAPGQG